MNTRIKELEDHIQRHRDDNDAWLVLSDALQELEDPRGEIIALEMSLEGSEDSPTRDHLVALKRRYSEALLGPVMDLPSYSCKLKRGYLSSITLPRQIIVGDLLAILKHSPFLESLRLRCTELVSIENIIDALALVNITELNIMYSNIDDANVFKLSELQALKNLTSLILSFNNIGPMGAKAIAQSPNLKNLTELDLGNNELGPEGSLSLAQSPNLKNLTSLNLAGNNIGDEGAIALAQSPNLKNLTKLDLRHNGISSMGKTALLESPHLSDDVKESLRLL